jgi:multimeric flavodoxin WrbA
MKITAIVGSPRPRGNTDLLIDQALEEAASRDAEIEKIILSQYRVGPCLGHQNCNSFDKCKQDDDIPEILDRFRAAEGIILGSPVYYYGVTAQMKAFIDRNYFLFRHDIPLAARCAGLVVVAGGGGIDQTVRALRRYVKLSTEIPDEKIFIVSGYASRPGDVNSKPSLLEEVRKMGAQMVEILANN